MYLTSALGFKKTLGLLGRQEETDTAWDQELSQGISSLVTKPTKSTISPRTSP